MAKLKLAHLGNFSQGQSYRIHTLNGLMTWLWHSLAFAQQIIGVFFATVDEAWIEKKPADEGKGLPPNP